jgi:hypothetical protein
LDCPVWQIQKNSKLLDNVTKSSKWHFISKNKSTKGQSKDKASRIKHQTCYTYHDKGHLSKDYPKTQTFIHKVVNDNIPLVEPKNDTSTTKVISSPCCSPRAIWVPKQLLTNYEGPKNAWVPKLA